MNYDVFLKLENNTLIKSDEETEQRFMERIFRELFAVGKEERIYAMLRPRFRSCDAAQRSLAAAFTVEPWMLNPQDTLHGGVMSTALDMTMSVLARYCKKQRAVSTVQLSVNFLRPINDQETFIVIAEADHVGRRSVMIRAEIRTEINNKLVATASGVFM